MAAPSSLDLARGQSLAESSTTTDIFTNKIPFSSKEDVDTPMTDTGSDSDGAYSEYDLSGFTRDEIRHYNRIASPSQQLKRKSTFESEQEGTHCPPALDPTYAHLLMEKIIRGCREVDHPSLSPDFTAADKQLCRSSSLLCGAKYPTSYDC